MIGKVTDLIFEIVAPHNKQQQFSTLKNHQLTKEAKLLVRKNTNIGQQKVKQGSFKLCSSSWVRNNGRIIAANTDISIYRDTKKTKMPIFSYENHHNSLDLSFITNESKFQTTVATHSQCLPRNPTGTTIESQNKEVKSRKLQQKSFLTAKLHNNNYKQAIPNENLQISDRNVSENREVSNLNTGVLSRALTQGNLVSNVDQEQERNRRLKQKQSDLKPQAEPGDCQFGIWSAVKQHKHWPSIPECVPAQHKQNEATTDHTSQNLAPKTPRGMFLSMASSFGFETGDMELGINEINRNYGVLDCSTNASQSDSANQNINDTWNLRVSDQTTTREDNQFAIQESCAEILKDEQVQNVSSIFREQMRGEKCMDLQNCLQHVKTKHFEKSRLGPQRKSNSASEVEKFKVYLV